MRVVIAEDLFLLRAGLTRMLRAHGLEITAAVDNGADLLAAVTSDRPDDAHGGDAITSVLCNHFNTLSN